jgi:thermostable 8-oxoguanine DNA glycosylase
MLGIMESHFYGMWTEIMELRSIIRIKETTHFMKWNVNVLSLSFIFRHIYGMLMGYEWNITEIGNYISHYLTNNGMLMG